MTVDMPQLLVNGMRTPDGTEIFSRSRHDCVQYTDANGETYMVDGGMDYLHHSVNDEPGVMLTIHMRLPDPKGDNAMIVHEYNRQHFHWGSRGVNNDQELMWKPLMSMSTAHINAILITQHQISGMHTETLFKTELEYRKNAFQD